MINDTCQTPLIIFCLSPPYILRDFVVIFCCCNNYTVMIHSKKESLSLFAFVEICCSSIKNKTSTKLKERKNKKKINENF